MDYGIRKELNSDFDNTVMKVKDTLLKEGFGVLTEIDVQETLQKKLGEKIDDYILLGVCHPPYAHQALLSEKEIGLLLPCNVIIYKDKEKVVVSAIKPTVAMNMIDNPNIKIIAKEVERKLANVIVEI